MTTQETAAYLLDLFHHWQGVRTRPMMGGHCLYFEDRIFGVYDDGELFFKVDSALQPEFERRDCHQFSYSKKDGSLGYMNYWTLPAEILDDPELLRTWMERSAALSKPKK